MTGRAQWYGSEDEMAERVAAEQQADADGRAEAYLQEMADRQNERTGGDL